MDRYRSLIAAIVVLLVTALADTAFAAGFHVSPEGTPQGIGTFAKPWDLQTALNHPAAVKPGDDIYLHTGIYKGSFTSRLKGTAAAPITVRPFHGEQATLECYSANPNEDPLFTVEGQYTIFRGFEVTCRNPLRTTQIQGSSPEQIKRGGISCRGTGISFINLIVHDCANGLGFWADGEGGEIYGCIIYNNGWIGPDRGHGHGIYTQNKAGTKILADNVIFNQFSHGIHAYGSAQAFLQGFQIEGNVCFNNGLPAGAIAPDILIGGECPAREIALLNNFT
ncbi:MAG TPA: right-handed parallel beta-helix repeat-containing protein, partial [Tepidisphaeraceae bacterium]|nr:right-handed parallel beta-helix repeat-containing protein [Tepidisphaeraceae bacterium]